MAEYLDKAGSKLSLMGVYGLLHGCIAAPHMVMPSVLVPVIFGEEGAEFESMEKAEKIMGNLMSLWNIISGWRPASEQFLCPGSEYPVSSEGIRKRIEDNKSLIKYFIKGLDMGKTMESDFSEDGLKAVKSLSEADTFYTQYDTLLEKEESSGETRKTAELFDQLEHIVGDCIARINLSLQEARMNVVEEMREFSEPRMTRGPKIPRNAPCPCGSGKKYKKCCGLTH